MAGCQIVHMSMDEIINGRGDSFPGLMGVVNAYLNSLNVDVATKCELRRYLDLIKYRAKGEFEDLLLISTMPSFPLLHLGWAEEILRLVARLG